MNKIEFKFMMSEAYSYSMISKLFSLSYSNADSQYSTTIAGNILVIQVLIQIVSTNNSHIHWFTHEDLRFFSLN